MLGLKERKLIVAIFLAVISVVFCSPGVWGAQAKGGQSDSGAPVSVEIMTAGLAGADAEIRAVGRAFANKTLTIKAEVSGRVTYVGTDMGGSVKAGQVLVRTDPEDFQLAYEEARAGLASTRSRLSMAKSGYQRAEKLKKQKVISHEMYEKLKAEFEDAGAQSDRAGVAVRMASARLKKTSIKAPFSGLVVKRHIEVSEIINPGQPLITLADLNRIKVKVRLGEKDYINLDRAGTAVVTFDVFPEREFIGRIGLIGIAADPGTTTFPVEVLVENKDLTIKPGLSARVFLPKRATSDEILIPQSAVIKTNGDWVFVVGPGRAAEKRRVVLGGIKGLRVRVLEGLQNGDKVILNNLKKIKPGDKVTVSSNK